MEYRSNATAGFVLPPPTILQPSHGSGWPIAAIPEHSTKQEFDRIPVSNTLQPLVHDDLPLHKMSNGGYRNEESPISPYDPSNSIKTTQPTSKPTGNGAKTRPPRRSSANGVVACRQWYVDRQICFVFLLTIHSPQSSTKDPLRLYQTRMRQLCTSLKPMRIRRSSKATRSGQAPRYTSPVLQETASRRGRRSGYTKA